MRNVGSGVDFKYMEPTLYNNPKVGSTNIDSQSKSTISNNIISISSSANENLPYILVFVLGVQLLMKLIIQTQF